MALNVAEGANHAFRWRVKYQEQDMGEAFCHFQDWQRSSLNEFARAFLGLGDYRRMTRFGLSIYLKLSWDQTFTNFMRLD